MTNDIEVLPEWSRDWARLRQGQHLARGHEVGTDEWAGLRDWLASLPNERPRMVGKLHKLTLEQALLASRTWHQAMATRSARIALQRQEHGGDPDAVRTIAQLAQGRTSPGVEQGAQCVEPAQQEVEPAQQEVAQGWRWVEVTSPEGLDYEGAAMGHCVGRGGYDQGCTIYSLRDGGNIPHCTIEYHADTRKVEQVQGRGNAPVVARYHTAVAAFVSALQPTHVEGVAQFGHVLVDGTLLKWGDLHDDMTIQGDFNLRHYDDIAHLPDNLAITGCAAFSYMYDLRHWPTRMRVGNSLKVVRCPALRDIDGILDVCGDFSVSGCESLESISAAGRVGGELSIGQCHTIKSLPPNLRFNSSLYIQYCDEFSTLPQGLNILGSLSLHECRSITSLPKDMVVRTDLRIRRCPGLTALPSGLAVGNSIKVNHCNSLVDVSILATMNLAGSVDLSFCRNLTTLPPGLRIPGDLCLNACHRIIELPPGLVVEGDLVLQGCTGLRTLPHDLVVRGNLCLAGAQALESIPRTIRVDGNIIDCPDRACHIVVRAIRAVGTALNVR